MITCKQMNVVFGSPNQVIKCCVLSCNCLCDPAVGVSIICLDRDLVVNCISYFKLSAKIVLLITIFITSESINDDIIDSPVKSSNNEFKLFFQYGRLDPCFLCV